MCLLTLSGCSSSPILQSGCVIDRSLIVELSDHNPGTEVTVGKIVKDILPAMVDDIHRDNLRKQELHKQLDTCGV